MALKTSLGIGESRDGISCGDLVYGFNKFIIGCNFEKSVGGLRSQGVSTRLGGSPVILQLKNCGAPAAAGVVADDTHMSSVTAIFVFAQDLVVRTGGVEIRS